jgi:hypothetical protein
MPQSLERNRLGMNRFSLRLAVVKTACEPRSRQLSHSYQETRHEKQGANTYQRRAPPGAGAADCPRQLISATETKESRSKAIQYNLSFKRNHSIRHVAPLFLYFLNSLRLARPNSGRTCSEFSQGIF